MPDEIQDLLDDASGDVALGDLDAAIAKYRHATELAPESFESWHALCLTLMKAGHIDEAIAAGETGVKLAPNDQLAWSSLSLCYVRANRIKDAESAGVKARVLSWGAKLTPDTDPGA